jgi:hypothetical protein
VKERDTVEVLDEDDEDPPTTYGDQSYDQRTCIHVLNRETLEREYNMTHMNFSNSIQKKIYGAPKDVNGQSEVELGKKKADAEVFENGNCELESPKGLKKLKEDFFLRQNFQNRSELGMFT